MSKRAKREQDKVAESGEILKEQLFTDSTGVFLLDGNDVMELKAAEIVDWQYGGLPDGYQLIMIPYSVERTNLSNPSGLFLQVGDGYYGRGEKRTYGGVPEDEYVDRLEADTGGYVGLIDSDRFIPPKTKVTLQYDISMNASYTDEVHEIYIYDSHGQVASQGYKLMLE